jgi:hypothetical protein
MKKLVLLLFLFVAVFSYAQCTQCGGSKIQVLFSSAIVTDTNGVDSTITGNFVFVLDFEQNLCTYTENGQKQWIRTMQHFGIVDKNKYFIAGWNSEKNPALRLGLKAESITIDLRSNSCVFQHDIARIQPYMMTAINPLIVRIHK